MAAKRIKTAAGVIWTRISEAHRVAVAPGRNSPEGCILLAAKEERLLARFSTPKGASPDGLGPEEKETIEKWLTPGFGLLTEVAEPRAAKDHEELALSLFQEYSSARELAGKHDLAGYHKTEIKDALRQFEEVETTVSHLYRESHPVLGGMSYGARFADTILADRALSQGSKVLEVGCGTGIFGRELLNRLKEAAPEVYESLSYTFFDLSPVLGESQREINEIHREIVAFESGDVLSHPFPEEGYDLIISNEMIADLPVVKMVKGDEPGEGDVKDALDAVLRLGLDLSDAAPEFLLNIGALKFLERLPEILAPGGRCYVVEYGSPWAYPAAQMVTDHVEYSIHFGHLVAAARSLGLGPELLVLTEFLGFMGDVEVLGNMCHHALFGHLLPFLGMEQPGYKVYTKEMLAHALPRVIEGVENLEFVPVSGLGGIVYPDGFYVLKLERGSTSSPPRA